MKINKLLVLAAFVLFSFSAALAVEVSPEKYGAVADDDQDDTAAIQSAVNEVIESGGGTVRLPAGRLLVRSIVFIVPVSKVGEVRFKGDSGAIVEVSTYWSNFAFYAGNLNILSFEDIIFTGKQVPWGSPEFWDSKYVIFSNFVQQTTIARCQFYGLAVPSGFAIVYFGNTDGKIVDSQFDGNTGQFPDGALVLAENSRGLTVSRTTFLDYGNLHGTGISKVAGTGAWVKVRGGTPLDANGIRRIVIEDSRFDEGAATAVSIENVPWVNFAGNSVNVSFHDAGRGLYLKDVEYARVDQSWFGYAPLARPALDLLNVGAIEISGLKLGGSVYFVRQSEVDSMSVKFCDQCGLPVGPIKPKK